MMLQVLPCPHCHGTDIVRIKGYDGGKQVKGRKRHVLVDTLGLLLSVEVTPANTSDQAGARRLLIGLKPLQPRLELIWAASA
jgi:putative transposase